MQTIRKKKIESLLRETVSLIVLNGEIKDPRINEMVTITGVDITADSRDAKIYVSVLSDTEVKDEIINTLNHAAGYIQKLISKRVRLKNTPRLAFYRDDSLERGFKMNQMLNDLQNGDQGLRDSDLVDKNLVDKNLVDQDLGGRRTGGRRTGDS